MDLAGLDREVDVVEGSLAGEGLRQAEDLEHRACTRAGRGSSGADAPELHEAVLEAVGSGPPVGGQEASAISGESTTHVGTTDAVGLELGCPRRPSRGGPSGRRGATCRTGRGPPSRPRWCRRRSPAAAASRAACRRASGPRAARRRRGRRRHRSRGSRRRTRRSRRPGSTGGTRPPAAGRLPAPRSAMVTGSDSTEHPAHWSAKAAVTASSSSTRIGKSRMVTKTTLAEPPESAMTQSASTSLATRTLADAADLRVQVVRLAAGLVGGVHLEDRDAGGLGLGRPAPRWRRGAGPRWRCSRRRRRSPAGRRCPARRRRR